MNEPSSPVRRVEDWIETGVMRGASLLVLRAGEEVIKHHGGLGWFTGRAKAITDDTLFMIASITKTLTAACFMQFVEEGTFGLSDRVVEYVPEFGQSGKDTATFLHLLTHTSGLAEQIEGKDELRAREASMDEFLDGIYRSRPLFTPGEGWQYSNCGFAVLARAVELAEGKRFGEVLAERILSPLGMDESALGFEGSWDERVAEIELPKGLEKERAFLNTRYWRALGAPWGALVSNTENLARFGEAFRNGGELDGKRILASATVEAMTQDQLHVQPRFPTRAHPGPHGLAWRIRGKAEGGFFGDLTAPDSYGHTGATGTFLWVDPTHELTAVFLSNKEGGNDEARFARLSNAIVAACT